jgi:type I restriction enzyme S subunit
MANAPLEIIDGDRSKAYPTQNDLLSEGYCLFLSATNVTKDGLVFEKCQFITEQKDNELRKGRVSREDVILTTRGTLGNVAYYSSDIPYDHVRINSGMVTIRARSEELRPRYLYYYLKSELFQAQVRSLQSGAAQPQLPIRDIKKIRISYPNVTAQDRIAELVGAYDDLIENNRRRIKLLEDAAQLLYREWFVDFRFPGHEHVNISAGIPCGWELKTFADVCETIGGGTPSTQIPSYWSDADVTWITPTDITKNNCLALLDGEKKISQLGLKNSAARLVPPYTILMTSRASVGFFGMIDREVCTNQGFINIIPNDNFLRYYLLFNLIYRVEEIRSHAGGSTYAEISKSKFRALPVLMPTSELLRDFDEKVQPVLDQVRVLKKQSENLSRARDLLLPRLMEGRLEV